MRFEVKRSEWYRGFGGSNSHLFLPENDRDDDKCRCCLWFFANACGLSDKDIENIATPDEVPEDLIIPEINEWDTLFVDDKDQKMMNVNDDETLSDKDREEQLIVLFDKAGHEIVFVD